MSYKVGILGAGFIARVHADVYKQIPDVELIGIAGSRTYSKVIDFAKRYNCIPFISCDKLISQNIDIIDICLPTHLHCEFTVKASQFSKHVLCEKPISLTLPEADKMITSCHNANVRFMVAHVIRFWPEYIVTKHIIDREELGKPLVVTTFRISKADPDTWFVDKTLSGGALIDLAIHDIDYLTWLFGKPYSIFAIRKELIGYEHLLCLLEYEHNIIGSIETGFYIDNIGVDFAAELNIICEKGCIELNSRSKNTIIIRKDDNKVEYPELPEEDGYYNEITYFLKCIKQNMNPVLGNPQDARLALEIALGINKSAKTGTKVEL